MAYRLDSDNALRRALRKAAQHQLARAATDLRTLAEEEAVHALRKHCKKMRALLRLVRSDAEALYRAENAHYRALAETLAASRDAVSLRDALDKLAPVDQYPHIRAFLEARIAPTGAEALQRAAALLEQGASRVDHWPLQPLRWRSARRGYQRGYRRAREAMHDTLAEATPEQFHEYRKRVKDQWYHTRLLEGKYRAPLHGRRKPLKTLAQALGDWRDLQLLRRLLALEGNAFHSELIPLLDASDTRLDALQRQIETLGQQLFATAKFRFGRA
ncbi:CHAD domain-containing protein [Microbulbifer sp. SAOS-129_SWC]|uniref:CHAD domain-containing protein n=1 Tax=Microbulbifer sp. SAOS-129_SWC TaxID=3145235 RepID=UPI003217D46F